MIAKGYTKAKGKFELRMNTRSLWFAKEHTFSKDAKNINRSGFFDEQLFEKNYEQKGYFRMASYGMIVKNWLLLMLFWMRFILFLILIKVCKKN